MGPYSRLKYYSVELRRIKMRRIKDLQFSTDICINWVTDESQRYFFTQNTLWHFTGFMVDCAARFVSTRPLKSDLSLG